MATNGEIEVEASSGNVFADLGLADPQAYVAKAELVRIVRQAVKARGWTQRKAALEIGVSELDMSDLMRGKLRRFSIERIERFLNGLNYDVEIRVRDHGIRATSARTSVVFEPALEAV